MTLFFRAAALLAAAFLVPTVAIPASAREIAAQPAHQRVLPLEGGQNFRDLGGYRTADGHHVRWGRLYRSGSMHFLTAADFAYLRRLGIVTVCDFRDTGERASEPVAWPAGQAPHILADDYRLDSGAFLKTTGAWTAEKAHGTMAKLYPGLLVQFNGQYRRMFAELLAGHAPLAFNCTAGKDRTGVASALLLTALGVPRETVIEDYLLSNRTFDPEKAIHADDQASAAWRNMPPAVLQAFMGADRDYIEAVFRVTDAHKDGTMGYLRDELGLGRAEIARLRKLYTR